MKNSILLILVATIISCAPQKENETANGNATVQGAGGCEELQAQIDSLTNEIIILKSDAAKMDESSGSKHKSKNEEEVVVSHKKTKPKTEESKTAERPNPNKSPVKVKTVAGEKDKDGSVRCSFTDSKGRCKKRTFDPSGRCWQHGGN
jgi:hypothetical protein